MNFANLLSSGLVLRIGWTLIHSTWEGTAVAALLALVLVMMKRCTPAARYLVCVGAMGVLLAALVVTASNITAPTARMSGAPESLTNADPDLIASASTNHALAPALHVELTPQGPTGGKASATSEASHPRETSYRQLMGDRLTPALPWACSAWALGVVLLSIWHLGGWIAAQRMRAIGIRAVPDEVVQLIAALCGRMGIRRVPRVFASVLARSPMVIGAVEPVILVPVAVMSGFSPAQLEAIFAHELAHIRRHDYVVNLFQVAAETLLFYHPAVWFISRRIRLEREQCCDDIAISVCQDRCMYAGSLAALEELRAGALPAMAATGTNSHQLLWRVRRVLGLQNESARTGASVASALSVLLIAGIVTMAMTGASSLPSASAQPKAPAATQPATTAPSARADLPPLDGASAKGLKLECRVSSQHLLICRITNTTNQTKPVGYFPDNGGHFTLQPASQMPWTGGQLPKAKLRTTKSFEERTGYPPTQKILYLPPNESVEFEFEDARPVSLTVLSPGETATTSPVVTNSTPFHLVYDPIFSRQYLASAAEIAGQLAISNEFTFDNSAPKLTLTMGHRVSRAELQFRLVVDAADQRAAQELVDVEHPGEKLHVLTDVALDESDVAHTQVETDQTGQPAVSITFTDSGSEKFHKLTSENVGHRLAIVLDGAVLSAPTIRTPMSRSAMITGHFTAEHAKLLSDVLNKSTTQPTTAPATQASERTFPDRAAEQVVADFRTQHLSFVPDDSLKALGDDLRKFLMSAPEPDAALSQSILTSLHRYITAYFPSDDAENVYLNFQDRYGTLKWKLWLALTRPHLTASERTGRNELAIFLEDAIFLAPDPETVPRADRDRYNKLGNEAGAKLNAHWADPLDPIAEPFSKELTLKLQRQLQRGGAWAKQNIHQPADVIRTVEIEAINDLCTLDPSSDPQSPRFTARRFPLPDSVIDMTVDGDSMNLRFLSNSLFRGWYIQLHFSNAPADSQPAKDQRLNINTIADVVSYRSQSFPVDPAERERWLAEKHFGDLIVDSGGQSLAAVRGAKIAPLAVADWFAADRLTDAELLGVIDKHGAASISIADAPEDPDRSDANGVKPPPRFYVVYTAEHRLSVIRLLHRIDGVAPECFVYIRTRPATANGG